MTDRWWVIHEEEMHAAIKRAAEGEDPDLVMVELVANSEPGEPESDAPISASPIATILPHGDWMVLQEAIEAATDPDQPLIGLADNLTALVNAASAALDASWSVSDPPGPKATA